MRKLFIIIFFIHVCFQTSAQIEFQKSYTGGGLGEKASCADSGYAMIGGGVIIRVDKFGDTLWSKSIINQGTGLIEGYIIQPTFDNGFIVLEHVFISVSPYNISVLMKIDSNGNYQWSKAFNMGDWYPTTLKIAEDSGFIFTLRSVNSGSVVIKTNQYGDVEWSNRFIFNGDLLDIIVTDNNAYILTGYELHYPQYDNALLVKIDSSGNTIWSKRYGGNSATKGVMGQRVVEDIYGGYCVVGNYYDIQNYDDSLYVFKTNSNGDLQWSKKFCPVSNAYTDYGVLAFSDGGFLLGCTVKQPYFVPTLPLLIRIDSNGDTLWTKAYSSGANNISLKSLSSTTDNGFLIGGSFYQYAPPAYGNYLIKTDSLGNSGCNEIHFPITPTTQTNIENNISFLSTPDDPSTSYDITLSNSSVTITECPYDTTILSDTAILYSGIDNINLSMNFNLFPNPTTNSIHISSSSLIGIYSIRIYNLLGQQMMQQKHTFSSVENYEMDVEELPKGYYQIALSNGKEILSKGFVKE